MMRWHKLIQLSYRARRPDPQAVAGRLESRPVQSGQIDQAVDVGLWLGEQPCSAGKPGIARAPLLSGPVVRSPDDTRDGVQVHRTDCKLAHSEWADYSPNRRLFA